MQLFLNQEKSIHLKKETNENIEDMLKIPEDQNSSTTQTSSVEQSIINEINK